MKTVYNSDLKAHLTYDDKKKVRHIRHSQEPWLSDQDIPGFSAQDYLQQMAETFQIPKEQLRNLQKQVSFFDPYELGIEYHLDEEKHLFDSITLSYYQTFMNVPVWRKGLSVKIKQNPNRVISSTNNSEDDIKGKLPGIKTIERYKKIFQQTISRKAAIDAGFETKEKEDETASFIQSVIKAVIIPLSAKPKSDDIPLFTDDTWLLSSKFFIYKYNSKNRYAGHPVPPAEKAGGNDTGEMKDVPVPILPPVSDTIEDGQSYLVAETIFSSNLEGFNGLVWLILVEIETDSILYIECMTCGVNGLFFRFDPIVKTGDLTQTANQTNAVLNILRDDESLTNLDAPVNGVQNLRGTYVVIQNVEDPNISSPTKPSNTAFNYDARTNDFGAVNAYYHETELFKTIESLGFPRATYFDGTTFPIKVDHRGMGTYSANTINAHWSPNGSGGTGHMCFALCDTSDITNPLCRSVDPWVHWHEMGGHGTLGDHVGSGVLGFSHSAGDGLAALQMDPESRLRALGLPERFKYAPFRPISAGSYERRFDRDITAWAWGGPIVYDSNNVLVSGDDGGYGSEQILATCHFRIYRSIGGDSRSFGLRKFASRAATYLIIRTIGNLTPGTNPNDPEVWCEEMQDTDLLNWTSEGLSGGAYNKVIRWAFEKQGCYQPAGAPTPVRTIGAPPAVDVYIEDGRGGEYQFKEIHWENMSMWNRTNPDGLTGHQNAVMGATNYIYVKVKNRGTTIAKKVTVRSFHTLPGAGLTWPKDFTEMTPLGGLTVPTIGANNTQEVTIGPFKWKPNVNAFGHDCILMYVSAGGDPSNVDNFTGTETISEWRLVPNDNNIGQRNVILIPFGSIETILGVLKNTVFFAGNSFRRIGNMEIKFEIPAILKKKGWDLQCDGLIQNKFRLMLGEKRMIKFKVIKGKILLAEEIKKLNEQNIRVYLYGNDILLGGMTYHFDFK